MGEDDPVVEGGRSRCSELEAVFGGTSDDGVIRVRERWARSLGDEDARRWIGLGWNLDAGAEKKGRARGNERTMSPGRRTNSWGRCGDSGGASSWPYEVIPVGDGWLECFEGGECKAAGGDLQAICWFGL